MFFLSFILFNCWVLVTDLGGKSSANLTYFGPEKTSFFFFIFEEGKLGLWKNMSRFFAAKVGQVIRTFAT